MKSRIIILALCAALLLSVAACALAESAEKRVLQLGTSSYTIEIDASYTEGEITAEEAADDMVAYLSSPNSALDFDVYQFSKEGYPAALAEFAAQEAADYSASEVVTDGSVNGIAAAWYIAEEPYDGQTYKTLTYILEDGGDYVEIVFWLDGDTADQEAAAIMDTLTFTTR